MSLARKLMETKEDLNIPWQVAEQIMAYGYITFIYLKQSNLVLLANNHI